MLRLFLILIQNNAGLFQICPRSDPFYDFSVQLTLFSLNFNLFFFVFFAASSALAHIVLSPAISHLNNYPPDQLITTHGSMRRVSYLIYFLLLFLNFFVFFG